MFTADADAYDGLHIPGGFINPDFLRQREDAFEFVERSRAAWLLPAPLGITALDACCAQRLTH